MIDRNTINQIQSATIVDRIKVIELLLESLKKDIGRSPIDKKHPVKHFNVRSFHLGKNVPFDRDLIYSERNG
jgi:hypothetical protein